MQDAAARINRTLSDTVAGALLSATGRRMYFPRGIVAQSGEAARLAHRLNATAGIATRGGEPLYLLPIREQVPRLSPGEIFAYAPTAGVPRLRELWLEEIRRKNPALEGKSMSEPVVVSGLTHGLSLLADLFVDPGDTVVLPDLFWGNYRLIFEARREGRLQRFALFTAAGALNVEALAAVLEGLKGGKVVLLLNFPNNPTGYTPSRGEAARLVEALLHAAEAGTRLLVVFDDAYFGLFYEGDSCSQSVFAEAAALHENILAVKVDGATKENLVWGFRIGFLTFACRGLEERHYRALIDKTMGALRSSVSSSSRLGQTLVLQALQDPRYGAEKRRVFELLRGRYRRSREILRRLAEGGAPLKALPFNSGYFLSFDTAPLSAEALRRELLRGQGIGTVAIDDRYLRVAYSSVDEDRLEELYTGIMTAASVLAQR